MRLRLFWKILFSFWLTFVCIMEGVWLVFIIYDGSDRQPWKSELARSVAEVQLDSASVALKLGGVEGLNTLLETWPEKERRRMGYEFLPDQGNTQRGGVAAEQGQESEVYSRVVPRPGSQAVRLEYDTAGMFVRHRPGLLHIPPELLVLGILGGLLFSSLLAWYLTAPVWRLREGFGQLARGRLGVRLTPLMGRRRDEIVDLALDFDRMAERMQALVESREQLLNDVSHELRSPLARMHMAIGLARQSPQRAPALLDRIEQESSRMDELVGELLTLSRVEYRGDASDEYFDLAELVRVVVGSARFESEGDGVTMDLRMPPRSGGGDAFTVRGDAELVRRALENVVRNAVRHSPGSGVVEVVVTPEQDGDSCLISITDHGPGVPDQSLERIFEPFVRLEGGSRSGGLGLAIAKRAITVHGGRIWAENKRPGGLCVSIVLPLEPTDPTDPADPTDSAEPPEPTEPTEPGESGNG